MLTSSRQHIDQASTDDLPPETFSAFSPNYGTGVMFDARELPKMSSGSEIALELMDVE